MGGKIKFAFSYVKFDRSLRKQVKDIKQAAGYTQLEFRWEAGTGESVWELSAYRWSLMRPDG